ncbi:siderophore-interacting protein [Snodgrassella sp. CFCC 13594]|uniref:siderophore-interacting protein n=1 Tax=Snodgrassella sp. CFCC 13594 TaxID=1775559 RepID=UPI0009EE2315|nr:siderophore-interacting protein [Snodgrassella sp. CFCC 13594]
MTVRPQRQARHITVCRWLDLSPNLRRIVFHAPTLADYPFHCNGAHIKLFFPHEGENQPQLPTFSSRGPVWADPNNKPIARTYTLREFDATACTLSVDFVKHGDNGPASYFAEHVQIGQIIGISEPAGPIPMLKPAKRYFMAGDLTALPAISAMLAEMDSQAEGDVLLWLPEQADWPNDLTIPTAIHIHPFVGGLDQIKQLVAFAHTCTPPTIEDFVWVAGEASMVAPLRVLARQQWQIPLARCYAVPYWRSGESEEAYHQKRHDFMDN